MNGGWWINTYGRARVSRPLLRSASNICPGLAAKTGPTLCVFRLDAVQKFPVGPQHVLGAGDEGDAIGAVKALGDERPAGGRVLDVELLVQVEVARRGLAVDAVALAQPGRLRGRDGGLRGLDRVDADERLEQRAVLRPRLRARGGLGRRRGGAVTADGGDEAVPQLDVRGLLGGVRLQRGLGVGGA